MVITVTVGVMAYFQCNVACNAGKVTEMGIQLRIFTKEFTLKISNPFHYKNKK